jgi:uncharacterized membrane protein
MSEHTVVAVSFADRSKAFEGLSLLRAAGADGRVGVRTAVVLDRDENGFLRAPDGVDDESGAGALGGGLIGMLVGLLGGPVGMLFGWTTGALIGGASDLKRAERSVDLLGEYSRTVPPGSTALVAELDEVAVEVVDGTMAGLGGTVVRRSAYEVLSEIEAAEEAADAAEKAARKTLREEKRAARKEDFEERTATLRDKLGLG